MAKKPKKKKPSFLDIMTPGKTIKQTAAELAAINKKLKKKKKKK